MIVQQKRDWPFPADRAIQLLLGICLLEAALSSVELPDLTVSQSARTSTPKGSISVVTSDQPRPHKSGRSFRNSESTRTSRCIRSVARTVGVSTRAIKTIRAHGDRNQVAQSNPAWRRRSTSTVETWRCRCSNPRHTRAMHIGCPHDNPSTTRRSRADSSVGRAQD